MKGQGRVAPTDAHRCRQSPLAVEASRELDKVGLTARRRLRRRSSGQRSQLERQRLEPDGSSDAHGVAQAPQRPRRGVLCEAETSEGAPTASMELKATLWS